MREKDEEEEDDVTDTFIYVFIISFPRVYSFFFVSVLRAPEERTSLF